MFRKNCTLHSTIACTLYNPRRSNITSLHKSASPLKMEVKIRPRLYLLSAGVPIYIYLCNGRRAKSLKEIYWNRPKVSLLSSLLSPATHQVGKRTKLQCNQSPNFLTFQEPRNRCSLCWNFRTIYGGLEPSRNRAVVPALQPMQPGGIDSLASIPGLLPSLKIPSLAVRYDNQATQAGGIDSFETNPEWNFLTIYEGQEPSRNRVARLLRLSALISLNQFLGSLKV